MAQRGVNKVLLIGNLGRDPEIKYMPSGDAVTNIAIATSEYWKDKETGEQVEKTEWHRCVAFGKKAEVMAQHLKKGSKIWIEGKLATRKWQTQSGEDRYSTEIVIEEFQFLDSRESSYGTGSSPQPSSNGAPDTGGGSAPAPASGGSGDDEWDDDIPF